MCNGTICGSKECPRYYRCQRSVMNTHRGQIINYYTFGHGAAYTDSMGRSHVESSSVCGERGRWGMYQALGSKRAERI